MPPTLKDGEAADPFNTRAPSKDQDRVSRGNPDTPVLSANEIGDEAMKRKKRAQELMQAQTRLKDY